MARAPVILSDLARFQFDNRSQLFTSQTNAAMRPVFPRDLLLPPGLVRRRIYFSLISYNVTNWNYGDGGGVRTLLTTMATFSMEVSLKLFTGTEETGSLLLFCTGSNTATVPVYGGKAAGVGLVSASFGAVGVALSPTINAVSQTQNPSRHALKISFPQFAATDGAGVARTDNSPLMQFVTPYEVVCSADRLAVSFTGRPADPTDVTGELGFQAAPLRAFIGVHSETLL